MQNQGELSSIFESKVDEEFLKAKLERKASKKQRRRAENFPKIKIRAEEVLRKKLFAKEKMIKLPVRVNGTVLFESVSGPATEQELSTLADLLLLTDWAERLPTWNDQETPMQFSFVCRNISDLNTKQKLIDRLLEISRYCAAMRYDRWAEREGINIHSLEGVVPRMWPGFPGGEQRGAPSLSPVGPIAYFAECAFMIANTPALHVRKSMSGKTYLEEMLWCLEETLQVQRELVWDFYTEVGQKNSNRFVPYTDAQIGLKYKEYLTRRPDRVVFHSATDLPAGEMPPWNRAMFVTSAGAPALIARNELIRGGLDNWLTEDMLEEFSRMELMMKAQLEYFRASARVVEGSNTPGTNILNWNYSAHDPDRLYNSMGHCGSDFFHNYVAWNYGLFRDEFLSASDLQLIANMVKYNLFAGISEDGKPLFCAYNTGSTKRLASAARPILYVLGSIDDDVWRMTSVSSLFELQKESNQVDLVGLTDRIFFILFTKDLRAKGRMSEFYF
ncbi:hypothetical protein [Pontiella sulfatireligans]|nr:hypothetical protein [Pontiella sulfatireligans]